MEFRYHKLYIFIFLILLIPALFYFLGACDKSIRPVASSCGRKIHQRIIDTPSQERLLLCFISLSVSLLIPAPRGLPQTEKYNPTDR
jgi:hypothetical protein